MPTDSGQSFVFDPSVVVQLACPACLGGLCLEDDKLACGNCGQAYPIVDGIPTLIAGRGTGNQR